MTTKRLILDTDIGTDVDDCLALALILASPEFGACRRHPPFTATCCCGRGWRSSC